MKLAIAQINSSVGDLAANEARIASAIREAAAAGDDVVVFPELAVTGYPPRDLLVCEDFLRATVRTTARLAQVAPDLHVILGTLQRTPDGRLQNVAAVLHEGRIAATRAKSLLPSGDVFDEPRYFSPGPANTPLEIAGRRVGLLVCEDLWDESYERSPAQELKQAGAELLICLNASPFRVGVTSERVRHARRTGLPLVYVNAVGAQDDLIFDGSSFALSSSGDVVAALPACEERVQRVDLTQATHDSVTEASVREALGLGIRDFVEKNRLPSALVGLSGGVDSALVLCLAAEALGPDRVRAVHIPSRFTSRRSTEDSRALCEALGVELSVVPLEPLHVAAEATLSALPVGFADGVAENAQARLRCMILMAFLNNSGGVLLNTSNKTELSLGYGTLYGDLAGGLGVIADLTKLEVYDLARQFPQIPRHVIDRPPSAELAAGQVDPFDYEDVSPILERVVQGDSFADLRNAGATRNDVGWLDSRLRASEFKRHQAPPGLKVSWRAFGRGRRLPLTHAFERAPAAGAVEHAPTTLAAAS